MLNEAHAAHGSRRTLSALLLCGALLGALGPGCTRTEDHAVGAAADEDAHGPEENGHETAATDAHHLAEHDGECEDDVTLSAEAIERSGIRVEPAAKVSLSGIVHARARVSLRSDGVARIGSPLHGWVAALPVKLGDRVQEHQVLLAVDCPELGQAQADYLKSRAEAEALSPVAAVTRSAWERSRSLLESIQGVTLTEVQKRETEYRTAERDLAIARAAADAAGHRLALYRFDEAALARLARDGRVDSRFELRAPFAGQIVALDVTLGEQVDPQKDALMVLADTERLWILAHVPESRVGEIVPGAMVSIAVPALDGPDFAGIVSAVAPTIDITTRNAEVRIEVDNADGRLKPGMFAQARISSPRYGSAAVLVVPDGAVQTVEGRSAVFVPIDEHGLVFCKHVVSVDDPVEGLIPVNAGLTEGDLVVASGAFLLKAEHGKGSASHDH